MGDVLVRNKAAEDFLTTVISAWAREFPEEAESFRQHVKRKHEALIHPSGLSRGGLLGYAGDIPVKIWYVVEAHHYGFFRNPRNVRLAHRLLMGPFVPGGARNFHYIDRRKGNESEPPAESSDSTALGLPDSQE